MKKRTNVLIGGLMVVFGLLLSGCEIGKSSPQNQEVLVPERPGVTIVGKLISTGNLYYVQESGKTTEVTSKKVDLKPRVGTQVTVYGEFSGTTLYVDEIK